MKHENKAGIIALLISNKMELKSIHTPIYYAYI